MLTILTGGPRALEKEEEAEFRLAPVVEVMGDDVLSPVKIEPPVTVVGDVPRDDPFGVDEGGPDGVVDEGEETSPPDDEAPLPDKELLEPEEKLLPLEMEEPLLGEGLSEGEPVEGEEFGGAGLCTGAGEGGGLEGVGVEGGGLEGEGGGLEGEGVEGGGLEGEGVEGGGLEGEGGGLEGEGGGLEGEGVEGEGVEGGLEGEGVEGELEGGVGEGAGELEGEGSEGEEGASRSPMTDGKGSGRMFTTVPSCRSSRTSLVISSL